MYKEHSEFNIGKSQNIPLWRYMDFWKFLKLVNSSEIFFPNVITMGDQNEGKIPQKVYKWMLEEDEKHGRKNNFAESYKGFIENNFINKIFILSWSANKNESYAFWKMYAREKLGIAIKTNVDRLINSFKDAEENIYIGEVQYFDEKNPFYKIGNAFYSYLVKNNYYEFESEVRCIIQSNEKESSIGKSIKINLNNLIEEIYISPFAEKAGLIEIIEFLKAKYNLNFDIKISGVDDHWI